MNVAIIGGGNGARTMAADFTSRGMSVRLWEDPRFFEDLGDFARTRRQKVYGALNINVKVEMVTSDIRAALEAVSYTHLTLPTILLV